MGMSTSSRKVTPPPSARSHARVRSDPLELVLELGELAAAGHQAHELLAVDLALAERAEALAGFQDHEAVPGGVRVWGVVGDKDPRHAAVARLQDVLQDDARLLDAECRRRLVEDQ